MSKPRGVVEPSMVAVSVNEYVGDVSRAGYYEGHGVAHFRHTNRFGAPLHVWYALPPQW